MFCRVLSCLSQAPPGSCNEQNSQPKIRVEKGAVLSQRLHSSSTLKSLHLHPSLLLTLSIYFFLLSITVVSTLSSGHRSSRWLFGAKAAGQGWPCRRRRRRRRQLRLRRQFHFFGGLQVRWRGFQVCIYLGPEDMLFSSVRTPL